jgi:hypothetical protein
MRRCACDCGRQSGNAMQDCFPVLPWDSPGLPPRPKDERCARHPLCAYRDDDPAYCGTCHGGANCTCMPAWTER